MFTYQQALDYIYSFVDQEKLSPDQYVPRRFDLTNMTELLSMLGDPHRGLQAVHVAGTKGKGSTCAMTASVLEAARYRVGLFTQPHLHTFRERIKVNERFVSEHEMIAILEKLKPYIEQLPDPSTFEIMTAMAFEYFAEQNVDLAVVETGLGGRLDTTNVIVPLVSVITSISYDHTYILGDTLEEIAGEKAGIIKEGRPVVCAPQRDAAEQVIVQVCRERSAPLILVDRDWRCHVSEADIEGQSFTVRSELPHPDGLLADGRSQEFWIPFLGRYQVVNATTTIATIDQLCRQGIHVSPEQAAEGLRRARWPGRLEILSREPLLVMDGAHNVDSVQRLMKALREYLEFDELIVIAGFSLDKDIPGMMRELTSHAKEVIVTQADHPRAGESDTIVERTDTTETPLTILREPSAALRHALELADKKDLVCVTGSLHLVGDVRGVWLEAQGVAFERDPAI
ncbi:MAG: bifunctional folylpolyglutamate synthase/dihydrofolate synthase [Anaerolineae bacterium]|nr:bifunctional folylpolyglutamate synthase/dihydrofolate synthase [Anaerolineae bacterium]NIN99634.1 bifunctional folylpolyglutamate synthase/dihydrofolate synthase [Anaerolineae bacterium]NIQ82486.1 bifunctional folylpolyglutamate synthase/dihydrofolate synthase [Anaerolineae bacterium]